MHCLMLLSSQRWFCALSGSARGRTSEFRDAHKGRCDARTSKKRIVLAVNGQARREGPGEPVRFECGSPSFAACPMKPDDRRPNAKRRQLIPARKRVILPERCA
jgi:hypothetical protein